jgi:hypothetical protein
MVPSSVLDDDDRHRGEAAYSTQMYLFFFLESSYGDAK